MDFWQTLGTNVLATSTIGCLLTWLGKARLQKMQNDLDELRDKKKANIDKTVYVFKAQFEKEFEIYLDISNRIQEITTILVCGLGISPENRKIIDTDIKRGKMAYDILDMQDEWVQGCLESFGIFIPREKLSRHMDQKRTELLAYIAGRMPFFNHEIYNLTRIFIEQTHYMGILDCEKIKEDNDATTYDSIVKKRIESISISRDTIFNRISQRIESLRIIT